jgi:hypothetical protein
VSITRKEIQLVCFSLRELSRYQSEEADDVISSSGPYWFWKVDGPPMAKKAKGETEGQGSFVAI